MSLHCHKHLEGSCGSQRLCVLFPSLKWCFPKLWKYCETKATAVLCAMEGMENGGDLYKNQDTETDYSATSCPLNINLKV